MINYSRLYNYYLVIDVLCLNKDTQEIYLIIKSYRWPLRSRGQIITAINIVNKPYVIGQEPRNRTDHILD
jgi:hypothetical protein